MATGKGQATSTSSGMALPTISGSSGGFSGKGQPTQISGGYINPTINKMSTALLGGTPAQALAPNYSLPPAATLPNIPTLAPSVQQQAPAAPQSAFVFKPYVPPPPPEPPQYIYVPGYGMVDKNRPQEWNFMMPGMGG